MSRVLERDLYEHDFFAWTRRQSKELRRFARTRPTLPLDLARIAEEIADLGKEQRNAVRSWTIRLIEHLLLLDRSPAEAPRRGWRREVMTFRDEIEDRLTPRCAAISSGSSPASTARRAKGRSWTWRPTRATSQRVCRRSAPTPSATSSAKPPPRQSLK